MRILYSHNIDYLHDLDANKHPRSTASLTIKHKTHLNLKMIQALAFIAIQTTVVTMAGTAPDGNYTARFLGTDALGVAFDISIPAFAASGNTNAQIAAGIESLIQTARGTTLAGIVTNETVLSTAITIAFATGVQCTVSLTVPVGATPTITRSFAATIMPSTRLNGWPVMPEYYEHVIRGPMLLHRIAAIVGLTAVTIIGGDANDDNGLLTSTSLAATGTVQTTALERIRRYEAAFVPQFIVTSTTDPFGSATAGEFQVELEYTPVPELGYA